MATYSYNDLLKKGSSGMSVWMELTNDNKNIQLTKFDKPVLGKIEGLDYNNSLKFDTNKYMVTVENDKLRLSGEDYNAIIGNSLDEKIFSIASNGGRRRRRRRTRKTVKRKSRKSKRKMYSRRR